jgi:hypothetical protein
MRSRERFYEYVFSRDGEEAHVLVRAWNADEAATEARRTLDAQGITATGRLIARPPAWSAPQRRALARSKARRAQDPQKAG